MASRFCRLLREAIADEAKAPRDYTKLVEAGSGLISTGAAYSIAVIGKQERGHQRRLKKIAKSYCGGG